jgi:hypothetical protein
MMVRRAPASAPKRRKAFWPRCHASRSVATAKTSGRSARSTLNRCPIPTHSILRVRVNPPERLPRAAHVAAQGKQDDFHIYRIKIQATHRLNPPAPLVFLFLRLCAKSFFSQRRKVKERRKAQRLEFWF